MQIKDITLADHTSSHIYNMLEESSGCIQLLPVWSRTHKRINYSASYIHLHTSICTLVIQLKRNPFNIKWHLSNSDITIVIYSTISTQYQTSQFDTHFLSSCSIVITMKCPQYTKLISSLLKKIINCIQ